MILLRAPERMLGRTLGRQPAATVSLLAPQAPPACSASRGPANAGSDRGLLARAAAPPTSRRAVVAHGSAAGASSLSSHCESSGRSVCVVGAGVVGLTAALRILQAFPGVAVTVVAERFHTETTTAGAAGIWGPYCLGQTPEADVLRWSRATYDHLLALAASGDAVRAGVSLVPAISLQAEPCSPPEPEHPAGGSGDGGAGPSGGAVANTAAATATEPFWRHVALGYRVIGAPELERGHMDGDGTYSWGYAYTAPVCEGVRYLRWLTAKLEMRGARLEQRSLTSLGQLAEGGFDAIVNCAGLGAGALLPDGAVHPIRGQIMRVRASWVTHAIFTATNYVIPNPHSATVVLGGTAQQGNGDTCVSEEDKRRIWEGCLALVPSLKDAEVLHDWVGLRPGRPSLRLEPDSLDPTTQQLASASAAATGHDAAAGPAPAGAGAGAGTSGGGRLRAAIPVLHNYGHGGAGLTLAWGCAGDVVEWVARELTL